jgi:hypothetical protein
VFRKPDASRALPKLSRAMVGRSPSVLIPIGGEVGGSVPSFTQRAR